MFSWVARSVQKKKRGSASSHDITWAGAGESRSVSRCGCIDAMAAMMGPLIGKTTVVETPFRQPCPLINLCPSHRSRRMATQASTSAYIFWCGFFACTCSDTHELMHAPHGCAEACRCELAQASKCTCRRDFKFHNHFYSLRAMQVGRSKNIYTFKANYKCFWNIEAKFSNQFATQCGTCSKNLCSQGHIASWQLKLLTKTKYRPTATWNKPCTVSIGRHLLCC